MLYFPNTDFSVASAAAHSTTSLLFVVAVLAEEEELCFFLSAFISHQKLCSVIFQLVYSHQLLSFTLLFTAFHSAAGSNCTKPPGSVLHRTAGYHVTVMMLVVEWISSW